MRTPYLNEGHDDQQQNEQTKDDGEHDHPPGGSLFGDLAQEHRVDHETVRPIVGRLRRHRVGQHRRNATGGVQHHVLLLQKPL